MADRLLEMAERVRSGNVVELPMVRQDIADYLGLTVETVSRTFSRPIVLRNRSALQHLKPLSVHSCVLRATDCEYDHA